MNPLAIFNEQETWYFQNKSIPFHKEPTFIIMDTVYGAEIARYMNFDVPLTFIRLRLNVLASEAYNGLKEFITKYMSEPVSFDRYIMRLNQILAHLDINPGILEFLQYARGWALRVHSNCLHLGKMYYRAWDKIFYKATAQLMMYFAKHDFIFQTRRVYDRRALWNAFNNVFFGQVEFEWPKFALALTQLLSKCPKRTATRVVRRWIWYFARVPSSVSLERATEYELGMLRFDPDVSKTEYKTLEFAQSCIPLLRRAEQGPFALKLQQAKYKKGIDIPYLKRKLSYFVEEHTMDDKMLELIDNL